MIDLGPRVSMVTVGDVSFARDVANHADSHAGGNASYVFDHVRPIFKRADISLINLESAIAPSEASIQQKQGGIYLQGHPETVPALKSVGATVVTLAHNHLLDMGPAAVLETTAQLRRAGIMAIGVDDKRYGDAVAMFTRKNISVAVLSFCALDACARARQAHGFGAKQYSKEFARSMVTGIRPGVDVIVVAIHWGAEYYLGVDGHRREQAHFLASIGVDVVLGHHPHVLQDHMIIGNTFVAFSLGNFVFDSHVCRDEAGEMTEASIAASPACRAMHPRRRNPVAAATRTTRIYRLGLSKRGFESASYLPCDIATELHFSGKPIYRPKPNLNPGTWVVACSGEDVHCADCVPGE